MIVYNTIRFNSIPFSYDLHFTDRITLIRGNSGTGKTFMYNILEDLKVCGQYDRLTFLNYKTEDFHKTLYEKREKCVLIDNADVLLNEEDRQFINLEFSNQYVLLGRNYDGLNCARGSFTTLEVVDGVVSLRKEF